MSGVLRDAQLVVKHTFLEFVDATSQARMPRDFSAPKTDPVLMDLGAALPHKPSGDLGAALPHEPSGLSDDDTEMESCVEHDGIDDGEDWEADPSLATMQQESKHSETEEYPKATTSFSSLQRPGTVEQALLAALAAAAAGAALDAAGFGSEDAIQRLVAQHCRPRGVEAQRISVAKALAIAPKRFAPGSGPGSINGRTTVMMRNLPNNYTRDMVMSLLEKEGFQGKFDFFYLPIDFRSKAGLGYAFVNLVEPSIVEQFWSTFDGYTKWVLPSAKVCHVSWSGPHQGQRSHLERYRNSPIMHRSVPDEFKPVVLKDGVRIAFPTASKKVKAPRRRN